MPLELPKFEAETLPNGANILAARVEGSDIVGIHGSLMAGSAFDPRGQEGVAEATARLLMRGTKQHGQKELSQALESRGIIFNISNNVETVIFHGKCRAEDFETLLKLMTEILFEPSFQDEEVGRVKGDIVTNIAIEEDDTRSMAEKRFLELIFPRGHPYGRDPLGNLESVKRLEREEIVDYHEHHYSLGTLILAAAGPFTLKEIKQKMPRALQQKEEGREREAIPRPGASPSAVNKAVPMAHKSQVDIAYGCSAIPRSHPDYYALRMADLILGGPSFALGSRLMKNLRDRDGLAYYAFSSLVPMTSGGYWYAIAGVSPTNLRKAVKGMQAEITAVLENGVDADELGRAKTNQVGRLAMVMETLSGVSAALREIAYFNLGTDYLLRFPEIVNALTLDDLLNASREHIQMRRMSLVVAGPVDDKSIAKATQQDDLDSH